MAHIHKMTTSGPYQEWISALVGTGYATLKFLDKDVMQWPKQTNATCTIHTFSDNGRIEDSRPARDGDFDKALAGKAKRLFILEGISRDYVEKLGSALDIEPEFFAGHLRSTTWEHFNDRSDAAMLPSVRRQTSFWTLEYLECLRLDKKLDLGRTNLHTLKPLLRRMLIRNPFMDLKEDERVSIGLVTRFISFWERRLSNGNFDAILLADPPLDPTLKFKYGGSKEESTGWSPYGGGFVDFANIDKREIFLQHSPPYPASRSGSIPESLLWRLRDPDIFISAQDRSMGSIFQRLVLSQWALTLAFLRRDFNSVQMKRLTGEKNSLQQVKNTLIELESCYAVLDRCSYLVRKSLIQLGLPVEESSVLLSRPDTESDTWLLKADWAFIWQELRHWIGETDRVLNLRLTNLSVLDSKRSRDDSQRSAWISESSNEITKLGQILLLVFTPAGLAYGILSMGENFSPGKKQFWIFFAIAIPLSIVTILTFFLWVNWSRRRRAQRIESSV